MFKNITKRDIKFFLLGILFVIIAEIILNWNTISSDILRGFQDGYNSTRAK